jgi:hypothetical protein
MLERKLPSKTPNPNVVLALQIMLFRVDWEPIYQVLAPEPAEFIEELRKVVDGEQAELYLGSSRLAIPASLLAYIGGQDLGQALLEDGLDLNPYVSSIEATSTVNPMIIKAIRALRTFRRSVEAHGEATIKPGMFSTELSGLRDYVTKVGTDDPYAVDAFNRIENLEKVLDSAAQEGADPRQRIEREIVALEADLRELKRRATASARATA